MTGCNSMGMGITINCSKMDCDPTCMRNLGREADMIGFNFIVTGITSIDCPKKCAVTRRVPGFEKQCEP